MSFNRLAVASAVLLCFVAAGAVAQEEREESRSNCAGLPTKAQLRQFLQQAPTHKTPANAPSANAGGLFSGTRMWAAVVNRDGEVCAFATSTSDETQVWPGSQAIAKAKAYTANAFSLDISSAPNGGFPLSTALLYTFVQSGHSLFGLNESNLLNADFLAPPSGEGGGKHHIVGGIITFGGGVALYRGNTIIGGLGVSGDTACTDHEIAKRVRDIAGMNPGGNPLADDIKYSSVDGASAFTHPLCPNTFRNGVSIGNELPSSGY